MGQWTWTHFDVLLILIPTIVIFFRNLCNANTSKSLSCGLHAQKFSSKYRNLSWFTIWDTGACAYTNHTQRTPKYLKKLKWNFPRNLHCRCLSGNCANCYSVWKSVLRIRLRANDHLTERTLYDCSVSQNTVTKLNQRLNPVAELSLSLSVCLISNPCTMYMHILILLWLDLFVISFSSHLRHLVVSFDSYQFLHNADFSLITRWIFSL